MKARHRTQYITPLIKSKEVLCLHFKRERENRIGGKGEKSLDLLMTILYYTMNIPQRSLSMIHCCIDPVGQITHIKSIHTT